jgi:hypothetical protein
VTRWRAQHGGGAAEKHPFGQHRVLPLMFL